MPHRLPALPTRPRWKRTHPDHIARRLLRLLHRGWRTHRALLLTNAAYAAAVAAIAAALVTQSTVADLLATLLAAVVAIARAVRRDASPY